MNIEKFTSKFFDPVKNGNGYKVICPAHNDSRASLNVTEGHDGRILLNCFAGCSADDIVTAMGLSMSDLFPDTKSDHQSQVLESTQISGPSNSAIKSIYRYVDADGKLLYECVRYEPKDFRWRRPDGTGGYIYDLKGVNQVPYRLPELLQRCGEPDSEIWLTEGEKDADTLCEIGFTASSFKNWKPTYNSYIEGAHVVLFSDHDAAGLNQAVKAADLIRPVAASIKIIDLFEKEVEQGQDVSDWIERNSLFSDAGYDLAENLALIVENAGFWTKTSTEAIGNGSKGLEIEFLDTVEELEISWLAKPLIPSGFFTLLDGVEGIGKTFAMLDIAKRITNGIPMPFCGEMHEVGKVLLLSIEDSPEYILKPRFVRMNGDCSRLAVLRGNFDFSKVGFEGLEETIRSEGISFVLIDPLFSFTGRADINSTSDVRPITDRLNQIAAKYKIAIVGIRHLNKSKGLGDARSAGAHSVAWLQGCRSGLLVGHDPDDKSKRGIAQHKLNIGPESKSVYGFRINEQGVFEWTGDADLTIETMLSPKGIQSNEDRSALSEAVRFLRETLGEGGMLKTDLDKAAKASGISNATLNRAKVVLSIKPRKSSKKGGWIWELSQDAQD